MVKSEHIKTLVLLGVPALLFLGSMLFLARPMNTDTSAKFIKAKVNTNEFMLEVADTPESRKTGLMNRTQMDQDKGMVFIFDNDGMYSFWMKNTLISLDILWLDSNYKIVYIAKNVPPCEETKTPKCPSYSPGVMARYVVELNAGVSDTGNIKVGDTFEVFSSQ